MPEKIKVEIAKGAAERVEFHMRDRRHFGVVRIKGKEVIDFSDGDFLGINFDPQILKSARTEFETYGSGAGSHRTLSGTTSAHIALERRFAQFTQHESALLFPSHLHVRIALFSDLFFESDGVVIDEAIAGPQLGLISKASYALFNPFNAGMLEQELAKFRNCRRRFVFIEHVSCSTGRRLDLTSIAAICDKHSTLLIVDDSFSLGVDGLRGAGVCEVEGAREKPFMIFADLSYAFCTGGAIVASDSVTINKLSSGIVFSQSPAPSPAMAAAAHAALDLIELSHATREKLRSNVAKLRTGLHEIGFLDARDSDSPVVAIMVGSARRAKEFIQVLFERGFLCDVVTRTTQFSEIGFARFLVSAVHSATMIDNLLQAISDVYGRLPPE